MAATSHGERTLICQTTSKETEYGTAVDLMSSTNSKAKKYFFLCDYICLSLLIICVIAVLGLPTLFHFLPIELVSLALQVFSYE